jgi:hypothetical protein
MKATLLWCTFVWVMVGLLLYTCAHSAELMQRCMPKPMDRTTWWTYRIVAGKQCWYRGKHTIPKQALYWERTPALAQGNGIAPDVGQPGVGNGVTPTAYSVAAPTFEQRWSNMMNDVAATLWLTPTPATQWKIGERH